MATVIDALVMTLGLDTADFDKNEKRAGEHLDKFKKQSNAVAKDVAEGGKKMAEGFSMVKTQLLGMLALLGASVGLKDFIATNVKGQAELGRLSRNLGVSAKHLEAWGLVAKEMGGHAQDAYGALQNVAGGLAEASIKGHSALTDAAAANGVNLAGVKNTEDALIRISARMSQLPRQQALYLANQLGVGGMFNQLELGPGELKKRLDAAQKLAGATEASTKAAEALQKKWADIQQRITRASEVAFAKLSPVLERLAERFATWLDSIDWDKVTRQIGNLFGKVNDVVQAFGGWKDVALVLGGILALKVLSPVLGLVSGLGRLIPLIAGTTAGLWAMAGAGAAAVGALVGHEIYKHTLEGNSAGDFIGGQLTKFLASIGVGSAQESMINRQWAELPAQQRKQLADGYASLSDAGRAEFNQKNKYLGELLNEYNTGKAKHPNAPHADKGFGNVNSQHSQIFKSNAELFSALEEHGGIPKGTLARMFKQESANGTQLLSKAGALGPFQFMPATAAENGLKGDEVMDLDKSAAAAAGYLVRLHSQFGSWAKAVAAYNAGPGNVAKYGGTPPFAETQDYVRKVMGGIRVGAQTTASLRPASNHSTSTAEVHIGKIDVNTQATDARGIASDMLAAVKDQGTVAFSNSGMN